MKRLHILAFNPWKTEEQDVTWGVGYHEDDLYDIMDKVRNDYPKHCTTFFFENGKVKTYKPLFRDQTYI